MSEEDQTLDVVALPKFDMLSYESNISAKDVKSLALRHGIPLDLHPVALTKGWTMDQLSGDMIGLRAIPDAMAWRHHDSDISDSISEDGFSEQDVQTLAKRVINLRSIPSGLLFQGGLATTWDFPGFRLVFKDTEGNYLCFPFLSGATIEKGSTLTNQDQRARHTVPPLSVGQAIPDNTGHQKEVEVEDLKIVATRERKARAAAKKREKKKQATSSPEPIRNLNPPQPFSALAATAESREDHSLCASPHDSANHFVHNYSDDRHDKETHSLHLGSSGDQSGRALTIVNTEVVQPSLTHQHAHRSHPLRTALQGANTEVGESSRESAFYVPEWSIHPRCRLDTLMWCRELMVHLAPPVARKESNALNNATALERAWFSLARGALAQTDVLERFENLLADFEKLAESHTECGDMAGKLVQARLDLQQSSHLYTSLFDWYKAFKSNHEGCAEKLEGLENHNRELFQANKDQALRIKELEDELARKDFALVYAERLNAERAQEKEKLVTQLCKKEMEKFDCIRKLFPTVVERLLQSHNEERSKEDLLALMSRMKGFDVYVDKKMRVEYDKLFEKKYPYVEKISRGFHHSVFDLLNVYPDSPPSRQAPPNRPSFGPVASTSAPPL
nr:hypothetical protein [Tanacetum cinerariifolium]